MQADVAVGMPARLVAEAHAVGAVPEQPAPPRVDLMLELVFAFACRSELAAAFVFDPVVAPVWRRAAAHLRIGLDEFAVVYAPVAFAQVAARLVRSAVLLFVSYVIRAALLAAFFLV